MREKRDSSKYARNNFSWNRYFHITSRNFDCNKCIEVTRGLITYLSGLLITFVVNGTALVLGACSYENSSCWLSLEKRGRRRRYCLSSVSTRVERKIALVNFIKLSPNELVLSKLSKNENFLFLRSFVEHESITHTCESNGIWRMRFRKNLHPGNRVSINYGSKLKSNIYSPSVAPFFRSNSQSETMFQVNLQHGQAKENSIRETNSIF